MAKRKSNSNEILEMEDDVVIEDDEMELESDEENDSNEEDIDESKLELEAEEIEANTEEKEGELDEFDSSEFETVSITTSTKSVGKVGVMSVINSSENGKRITYSKEVTQKIGNPSAVTIALSETKIAVSAADPNSPNPLKLGRLGRKGVIYSSELVKTLTEKYNLDFSNRVSITLAEVQYKKDGDKTVAVITML